MTPALWALRAAAALGVPEHEVVKTLLMESLPGSGKKRSLLVLMHADREVAASCRKRRSDIPDDASRAVRDGAASCGVQGTA
jgi:prolyl-tRNA editing enzyme YbaK/EbsC (Cys-tRNA(Pro) deacylase)